MEEKFVWKRMYTLVVILNVLYILLFSYLMTAFT
jgi:hypothetical protein